MLDISFDLSDTVKEFRLNPEETKAFTNYVLDRVTDEFMSQWEDIINTSLDSTRDEYKRAMYTDRPDDNTSIIGLTSRNSKLAMMIETGTSAFDEKEGFSKSNLKKPKKDGGWYLTIPFRHATSDAIMSEMIQGTKTSVLDFMKQGSTVAGKDLPSPHNETQTHVVEFAPGITMTYKHKSPIYEGMHRRDISSTLKEKRGGYFTFRRVSDKSEDESWIHPGFAPYDLMGKALQGVDILHLVDLSVQEFLDQKFG